MYTGNHLGWSYANGVVGPQDFSLSSPECEVNSEESVYTSQTYVASREFLVSMNKAEASAGFLVLCLNYNEFA